MRHVVHLRPDRVKQHFDPMLRDAPRYEHDPAATVIGRPALEPGRRMKDMLDAVDHRRPIGAFYQVHNTLEAQEISAAVLGKHHERLAEALAILQRLDSTGTLPSNKKNWIAEIAAALTKAPKD